MADLRGIVRGTTKDCAFLGQSIDPEKGGKKFENEREL